MRVTVRPFLGAVSFFVHDEDVRLNRFGFRSPIEPARHLLVDARLDSQGKDAALMIDGIVQSPDPGIDDAEHVLWPRQV